jgi:hypothetical protein
MKHPRDPDNHTNMPPTKRVLSQPSDVLSDDGFICVLAYTDVTTLGSAQRVCKSWKKLIEGSPFLWEQMYKATFGEKLPAGFKVQDKPDYKQACKIKRSYKNNIKLFRKFIYKSSAPLSNVMKAQIMRIGDEEDDIQDIEELFDIDNEGNRGYPVNDDGEVWLSEYKNEITGDVYRVYNMGVGGGNNKGIVSLNDEEIPIANYFDHDLGDSATDNDLCNLLMEWHRDDWEKPSTTLPGGDEGDEEGEDE